MFRDGLVPLAPAYARSNLFATTILTWSPCKGKAKKTPAMIGRGFVVIQAVTVIS